jgi:hypothetical protein
MKTRIVTSLLKQCQLSFASVKIITQFYFRFETIVTIYNVNVLLMQFKDY